MKRLSKDSCDRVREKLRQYVCRFSSIAERYRRRNRARFNDVQTLELRTLLTTYFYESFESGLGAHWSVTSVNPEARVSVRDLTAQGIITNSTAVDFTRNGNSKSLAFDSSRASGDDIEDLGIAIVQINLTGMTDGIMTFHHFEVSDNNHVLPDQHFTTTPGDGVSISRNGLNWYRLKSINGGDLNRSGDGLWQMQEIDLGQELSRINASFSAGLAFDNTLRLKFSQYDRRSLPTHGWAVDEIRIQDEADEFTLNRPRGAFHRFNLGTENDDDYYFRAAVYGTPGPTTPIIVSVHGSDGDVNFTSYSWRWQSFVSDPANNVGSLIVVSPAFVMAGTPGRFNANTSYAKLSWNTSTNAAADVALLQTVDAISSLGIGDSTRLRLWGFSAGGQFVGRFTAAHPDRVAAAVVGGPSSQILPDADISYPYGFGDNYSYPRSPEASLDISEYLKTRIMFWVGQDDDDPNHPQLERFGSVDSAQGVSRLHRAVNQFEAIHRAAMQNDLSYSLFEYELFVSEGDAHGWLPDDLAEIYEFMMRDVSLLQTPIKLHSRLVHNASTLTSSTVLPQHVGQVEPGEDVVLELWIEAPANQALGVRSGTIDIFIEPGHFDVIGLAHGAFGVGASGIIDDEAGRIRGFGGSTPLNSAGVARYSLFGQIQLRVLNTIPDHTQAMLAVQRYAQSHFTLTSGATTRTDLMPLPKVLVDFGVGQPNIVQGIVFEDVNGDGVRQENELGLPGRSVWLSQAINGSIATGTSSIEPDDSVGHGAYLQTVNPLVTLSAVGSDTIHRGVSAAERTANDASTGTMVFATYFAGEGRQTTFTETSRQLRLNFNAPTTSVTLDFISLVGSTNYDMGKFTAYNQFGVQVASMTTSWLHNGQWETLTVSRNEADIAYVIASAANGQTVRLDNLRFETRLTATTDADGFYRIHGVPSGSYFLQVAKQSHELVTVKPSPDQSISVADGVVRSNASFGIDVSAITLSSHSIAENREAGSTVGTFGVGDPDVGSTFTYSLVSGTGGTNNSSFTISGNTLRTAAVFDYEVKPTYSIRVRATDQHGLSIERQFTITVVNVNEAPTSLSLSSATVLENRAVGTTVGLFSATDPDVGSTLTYSLVSGTGSTTNSSFTINGNALRTAAIFDYESKPSYSIRVRVTDASGAFLEKVFTINVLNELDGTSGSDAFVLTYSTSNVSITMSVDGGAPIIQGTFPLTSPVTLRALQATDSVRVVGTSGNDVIALSGTAFTVNGAGIVLDGPAGLTLAGGVGNDTYRLDADEQLGLVSLDEAAGGIDTIDFSSTTTLGVVLNLSVSYPQIVNPNLTLKLGSGLQFEKLTGGSENDKLTGNSLANVLTGNAGDDILSGGLGSDSLNGGSGNDTYVFGGATVGGEVDTIVEGSSLDADTLDFSSRSVAVAVNIATGLQQQVHTDRALILGSGLAVENALGGSGNDRLTGNSRVNMLIGNAGHDILNGGLGSDSLLGGSGNDTYVFGGATVGGELDMITEVSNLDRDTLDFSSRTIDVTMNISDSKNQQQVHTDRKIKLSSGLGIEILLGGSGNDRLTGSSIANVLVGNAGNDTLIGNAGRDILIGGEGLDTISGGADDDIVIAGRTTHDASSTSLSALLTGWIASTPYSTRVAALRGGVGSPSASLIRKSNVLNDSGQDDSLSGGSGTDWFFKATDDIISDLVSAELLDLL